MIRTIDNGLNHSKKKTIDWIMKDGKWLGPEQGEDHVWDPVLLLTAGVDHRQGYQPFLKYSVDDLVRIFQNISHLTQGIPLSVDYLPNWQKSELKMPEYETTCQTDICKTVRRFSLLLLHRRVMSDRNNFFTWRREKLQEDVAIDSENESDGGDDDLAE